MDALEVLGAVLAALVVSSAAGAGLTSRWMGRHNRVDPAVRSPAPRSWALSPTRPAQLHRRLRRLAQLVASATAPSGQVATARRRLRRRVAPAPGALETAGRELVDRAVRLDARLVAVDRGARMWRARQLRDLAGQVAQLESAAVRIADLAERLRTHVERVGAPHDRPSAVTLDLDGYEAALEDLGVPGRRAD